MYKQASNSASSENYGFKLAAKLGTSTKSLLRPYYLYLFFIFLLSLATLMAIVKRNKQAFYLASFLTVTYSVDSIIALQLSQDRVLLSSTGIIISLLTSIGLVYFKKDFS